MIINIPDIGSKPLKKLISVVSSGLGRLYEPRSIRKNADAEAYKIEVLAEAKAKELIIMGEAESDLLERTKARFVVQETRRQENIEQIVEKSILYLEAKVSDKPVDEDWRTRFFNKAQEISKDEMQDVWAKILAKEVTTPGSISYRTLDVVSNLSKTEAELFEVACSLASGYKKIFKFKGNFAFKEFGLDYKHIVILRDAGLIHENDLLKESLNVIPDKKVAYQVIGNKVYEITFTQLPTPVAVQFDQLLFTNSGKELCELIKKDLNEKYFDKLFLERAEKGYVLREVKVKPLES